MRLNTFMMFLLAIVFGGAAVIMANFWLASQNSSQPTVAIQAPAEVQTTIVVAAKDFSFGEALQQETLREIPWPRASLPDGAYSKISELIADGRRVALTSITLNEPILKWKISGAGGRASLAATVAAGMRAVAVRVNDVVGVGGFILPGDRVDLLYIRTQTNNGAESPSTDVIVQNARVLAIDQIADEKSDKPVVAKVVTVEVSTVDAQKLALAQMTGVVSLSLRPSGSLDQAKPKRIVEEELVSNPSVYMAKLEQRDLAQQQLEASLNAKISSVEQRIVASDSSKEALSKKLAEIEKALKGGIANAGEDAKALREKYNALEAAVRASNGQVNEELRKRLAEFEASLRSANGEVVETSELDLPAAKTTVLVGVTRGIKRETYEVPQDGTSDGL